MTNAKQDKANKFPLFDNLLVMGFGSVDSSLEIGNIIILLKMRGFTYYEMLGLRLANSVINESVWEITKVLNVLKDLMNHYFIISWLIAFLMSNVHCNTYKMVSDIICNLAD